jgi:IS30 family transposase
MEVLSPIYLWLQEGLGIRKMSHLLGRTAISISPELTRNRGNKGYRPEQAHWMATETESGYSQFNRGG